MNEHPDKKNFTDEPAIQDARGGSQNKDRWPTVDGPRKFTAISLKLARALSETIMKLAGWKVTTPFVPYRKMVVIGGPHTSNWDFILLLLFALHWRVTCNWIGKDTLFKGMMGPVMRKLGGVSVDRSKSGNLVDQVVEELSKRESMILVITPEGTRGKVDKWKSGFYHIARGADVPIVAITADYIKKEGAVADVVDPMQGYDVAEAELKTLFAKATPRNPFRIGKNQ